VRVIDTPKTGLVKRRNPANIMKRPILFHIGRVRFFKRFSSTNEIMTIDVIITMKLTNDTNPETLISGVDPLNSSMPLI